LIVRLLNASDRPITARLGSGLLRIRAAERCDLLEHAVEPIKVESGSIVIDLPPRGLASLRLATDGP
jgi:hypothetical protein